MWINRSFEAILQHRAAIGNAASLMPLVLLLEERKRTNHLFQEIYAEIQELEPPQTGE